MGFGRSESERGEGRERSSASDRRHQGGDRHGFLEFLFDFWELFLQLKLKLPESRFYLKLYEIVEFITMQCLHNVTCQFNEWVCRVQLIKWYTSAECKLS